MCVPFGEHDDVGHSRLGSLPRTRKWQQVVGLIEHGASAGQVANATIRAAEAGFMKASQDAGVVASIWMLMQLPLAARSDDWTVSLRQLGVNVAGEPTLMELVAKVTGAVDSRLANGGRRSDLGEMAENALAETLSKRVATDLPSLFSPSPGDVRKAFHDYHTVKNFSSLARDFFARLTDRYLGYFLSKTLGNHVGEGRRFATLSQVACFRDALRTHCHEAAKIVEAFSGDWFSKTNWQQQGAPMSEVSKFAFGAMTKLTAELKEGAKDSG